MAASVTAGKDGRGNRERGRGHPLSAILHARGLLALLLMSFLAGGCEKSAPKPLALHPPPVETVAGVHWLGKELLAADTNSAFVMSIWNLPETKKLEAQTLDRLAIGLVGTNGAPVLSAEHRTSNIQPPTSNIRVGTTNGQGRMPKDKAIQHPASGIQHPTNAAPLHASTTLTGPAALLRPLLDDLLQQESFLEVREATNLPGELTFAIRLSEPRAHLWETNLAAIIESVSSLKPQASSSEPTVHSPQSTVTDHVSRFTFHSTRHSLPITRVLEIARAGEWTVLGLGHETNVLTAELLDSIRGGSLLANSLFENYWLYADVDLRRVSSALLLDLSLPADLPRMTADIRGDGQNVRTRGQFNFPQPLPADLPPWNIPTNLLHDPLSSFTAIRGLAPWLSSFKGWTDLQVGAPPDQLCLWAQSGLPFLTFCAAPLPSASNQVYQLTERLVQDANPRVAAYGIGQFAQATNFNGAVWKDVPIMDPSLRSVSTANGDFAVVSMNPSPSTNRPAPPALLYQLLNTTNLVAYDWETTGPRIEQLLFTGQFLRMATGLPQVPPESASVVWVRALEDRLGNCVTSVTKTGPAQLSLMRRSTFPFSAMELHLLVDWLESPRFPRGLHTLPAPPDLLPFQTRLHHPAPHPGTNSVAPAHR